MASARRRVLAGVLLAGMLAAAVGHGVAPGWLAAWPAGLAAWLAAVLLWPWMSRADRVQSGVLATLGVAGIVIGVQAGRAPDWYALLTRNHALLAMLAAVSFLRLVGMASAAAGGPAPRGFGAFVRTMLGVHVFGATINLSAVFIIGDRLLSGRAPAAPMPMATAAALSRCFTCGALYSPFFAAMGVVLIYVPQASFAQVVATGVPIAAFSLIYAIASAWLGSRDRLAGFEGYPLTLASLWVPAMLAAGVIGAHAAWPALSVLVIIAALAPLLAGLALYWRDGPRHAARQLAGHVSGGLPQMAGLLALFLSAGVLATGIDAALGVLDTGLPFQRFDTTAAMLTLLAMTALAAVGVHPLILVAAVAAWLAPLDPDPDLLASVFLLAWGTGGVLNPLSGTHIAMAARYRIRNWRLPLVNLHFALATLAFAYAVLVWRAG